MRIRHRLPGCLLALLFLLTACRSDSQILAFETLARSDGAAALGMKAYRDEKPALFVVTKPEEIDPLNQGVLAESPGLVNRLRALDYGRFFAILVVQGLQRRGGYHVTVGQILREGGQVEVSASFVNPEAGTRTSQGFNLPYHLVAVSRAGAWGQDIRFVLTVGGKPVVESIHFVP